MKLPGTPSPAMEWACPEHPEQRADKPGLCECGYAMIPVEDIVDRHD